MTLRILLRSISAVFSDFAGPSARSFLQPRRLTPEFLVSDKGQIIFNVLAQNCTFWSSLTLIHD